MILLLEPAPQYSPRWKGYSTRIVALAFGAVIAAMIGTRILARHFRRTDTADLVAEVV